MASVVYVQVASFDVDNSRLGNWKLGSWTNEVGDGIVTEAVRFLSMLDMGVVVQREETGNIGHTLGTSLGWCLCQQMLRSDWFLTKSVHSCIFYPRLRFHRHRRQIR
jgi:predicted lipase